MVGTDGLHGSLQPRSEQLRSARWLCLERVAEDGGARGLWNLLRLHSAGLADRELHELGGPGDESDWAAGGAFAEQHFRLRRRGAGSIRSNTVASAIPPPYPPSGADIFFTPRNLVTPYSQNWNLNVEQELAGNMALQLGYIGSKGTKLVRLRDANQPDIFGDPPNPNYGFMDEFGTISASKL